MTEEQKALDRAAEILKEYCEPNSMIDSGNLFHAASTFRELLASRDAEVKALREKLETIAKEADRAARAIGASARRGDQSMADTFRFIRDHAMSCPEAIANEEGRDG